MSPRAKPAIIFHDLTLGYDRHPAVHHINGEVKQGELLAIVGPNGAGKSTLAEGHHRRAEAARRQRRSRRADQARHRLSAAADRHRPQLPDLGVRLRRHGPVARDRRLARARCHSLQAVAGALATVGLQDLCRPSGRRALGRPVPARPVRAAAVAGRLADPARRAVPRRRCQDHRSTSSRSSFVGTAKGAPCSRRCTTSSRCARISRRRS